MNNIQLNGVSTHNLKHINVKIPKNRITAIYGRSGAGKSSLAFSSLYKVCSDEFEALENGYTENSEYIIDSYSGIIPAIAISQSSKNNNPRSTLYSYLNIAQILSFFTKEDNKIIPSFKYLKLNKPNNECPCCKGLGEIPSIDLTSIVEQDKSISNKPFLIWNKGTFSGLYKGAIRQRRAYYEGVMISAQNFMGKKSIEKAIIRENCPECLGSRINLNIYRDINVLGLNIIDFLTLPFSDILEKLKEFSNISELIRVLSSINDMGLGYLNFSRSIPSLSGGELQKLRFSRLLNSNISGVLLVIDEISSQINKKDFPAIFDKLKLLSKNNTVVLVEHTPYFIDSADYRINIGPEAGKKGGKICPDEQILPIKINIEKHQTNQFFHFKQITKNNVIYLKNV